MNEKKEKIIKDYLGKINEAIQDIEEYSEKIEEIINKKTIEELQMSIYELVCIINPDINDNDKEKLIEYFKEYIPNIITLEDMGIRQLAYETKGYKKGYYLFFEFKLDNENDVDIDLVKNIEKELRKINEILKFVIVKK